MIGQVSSTAVGTVITIDQNAVDFSLPCGSAGANRIGGAVGTVTNPGNYASVTMTFKNLNVVGAISNTAGNWYGGIIGIGNLGTNDNFLIATSYYGGVMNSSAGGRGAVIALNMVSSNTVINDTVWLQAASYVPGASEYAAPTSITGNSTYYSAGALTTGSGVIFPVATDWVNSAIWDPYGSALPKLAFEP
jgi:hypothetical protein